MQDIWAENLKKGINYVVIWCLDLIGSEVFNSLCATLTDICSPLRKSNNRGEIIHLPVYGFSSEVAVQNLQEYKQFLERGLPVNDFKLYPTKKEESLHKIEKELIHYHQPYGSVTCYFIDHFPAPKKASLGLPSVEFHLDTDPKPLFVFFTRDDSDRIDMLIGKLLKEFEVVQSSKIADEK